MNTIKLNTIGTPCKAGGNAGGGNSGGSGSAKRYFLISGSSFVTTYFIGVVESVRVENPDLPKPVILGADLVWYLKSQGQDLMPYIVSCAIDMNKKITNTQTLELKTGQELYGEALNNVISGGEATEITESEFYTI